jgi:SnoaL-like domain
MKNIFKSYVDAINNKDLEGAMALISVDAQLINSKYRPPLPAEGINLIRAYLKETVISQNGQITINDIQEIGDSIVASVELRSDRTKRLALDRILGTEKFTIRDGKIIYFEFTMNLEDSETKKFFDFVRNLEANRPK